MQERLGDRPTVSMHQGDCNQVIPAILDDEQVDRDRPCFAFLDQESTQLAWTTVERLAHYKDYEAPDDGVGNPLRCKIELWVLFNDQQLARMWPHDREKFTTPIGSEKLDTLMGSTKGWLDLWEGLLPVRELIGRYKERLGRLGYTYVSHQPIKDRASGRIQYHMIHATDHPSAESLMTWAKKVSTARPAPQLPGFDEDPNRRAENRGSAARRCGAATVWSQAQCRYDGPPHPGRRDRANLRLWSQGRRRCRPPAPRGGGTARPTPVGS